MKKLLLTGIAGLFCTLLWGQAAVSGNVTLVDGVNPIGTPITFTAYTNTASTDTAYADSLGDFAIQLNYGGYDISYDRDGYFSQSQDGLFLTTDTLLSSVVLDSIDDSWVELNGYLEDSTVIQAGVRYRVQNSISVRFGTTVFFEGGSLITFSEGAGLFLGGDVVLNGSAKEPISWVGQDGAIWGGVRISPMYDFDKIVDFPVFEHLYIENAEKVVVWEFPQEFKHCSFINSEVVPIESFNYSNSFSADSCFFYGSSPIRLGAGYTANLTNSIVKNTAPLVPGDTVYGIACGANCGTVNMDDCQVIGYNIGVRAKAGKIQRTLIRDNEVGIEQSTAGVRLYNLSLENNTFANNTTGFKAEDGTSATVNSSLFFNNTYDLQIPEAQDDNFVVEYSLFDDLSEVFFTDTTYGALLLFGDTTLGTNRGYPGDTYLNIFGDPGLELNSASKFYLSPLSTSSLGIDRGDPALLDEDGTTVDIGVFPYLNRPPLEVPFSAAENDTLAVGDSLLLSWLATTDVDSFGTLENVEYKLYFEYPNDVVEIEVGTDTTYLLVIDDTFTPRSNYVWWVVASDGISESDPSGSNTIYIFNQAPQPFNLLSPSEGEEIAVTDSVIAFAWEEAVDADEITYTLHVASSETGQDTTLNTTDTLYQLSWASDRWVPNATYSWYVVASDGDESVISDTLSLIIANEAPEAFTLITPASSDTLGVVDTLIMAWTAAIDEEAVTYFVNISGPGLDSTLATVDTATQLFADWVQNSEYAIIVGATDGQDTTFAEVSVVTENILPSAFSLLSPVTNASLEPATPISFAWQEVEDQGDQITYTVYWANLDDDTEFSSQGLTDTTLIWNTGFAPNTNYEWWVEATDGLATVESSEVFSFSVQNQAPGAFAFTQPTTSLTINPNDYVSFAWSQATDADQVSYSLRIFGGDLDSTLVFDGIRQARLRLDWAQNEAYQAYVVATDGVDSTNSDTVSFSVNNMAPGEFFLGEPSNREEVDATLPISFSWSQAADDDVVTYALRLIGADLDTTLVTQELTLEYENLALQDDSTYAWYVVATDGIDSTTSETRTFVANNRITGFGDPSPIANWTIYPNPSNSQIKLQWPSGLPIVVRILDVQGKEVYFQEVAGGNTTISLDQLKAGVYQVMVQEGKSTTARLLHIIK